ncbi:MAG: ABC transporter ATP-binding protein/permease, partial [Oscillospiraceae bacterium]|nr:ABC transporter ATP-binding protein/permease [Oscillospiraceae bacterium]
MLVLRNIVKNYIVGDNTVEALRGVDLEFRKNEFVSILGPSGCGKTTLLNIIGGLDRYTKGDLSVNGRSTKRFKDGDWDAYRNHSIGFVFQTYNLIPHQTVLSNVELALTLSGVSKAERRRRAAAVLERVGLGDQLYKKPNQISGGQMQRVAIARALINDPEILLADEPTGALDSETSVQIMDMLKQIANDRLVVMVTHNPDIAEKYSTRIIRLLDGKIISDTDTYAADAGAAPEPKKKIKKPHMSFFTALSLSLNNLFTKKTRTFLTAFAGSIGIIGIALILSLSNGMQAYISGVEEDTLSSYPISIEQRTMDISTMMNAMMGAHDGGGDHDMDRIYSDDIMHRMINTMMKELSTNDLKAFKDFIENGGSGIDAFVNDIKYGYSTQMNIYKSDTSGGIYRVNPNSIFEIMGVPTMMAEGPSSSFAMMGGADIWTELLGNAELLASQYDVLAGRMPEHYNEIVLIVNERNEVSDFMLYSLGLKDANELADIFRIIADGGEIETAQSSYTYEELLALTFRLVLNTDYYKEEDGVWADMSENALHMKSVVDNAREVRVAGILRPSENAAFSSSNTGAVGYTSDLMTHLVTAVNDSRIVREQKANPDVDVFTGRHFGEEESEPLDMESLTPEQRQYLASLSEEERDALMQSSLSPKTTYEDNLRALGASDLDNPSSISIYPKDFASKDEVTSIIKAYNDSMTEDGMEEYVIQYTDFVGLLMSSISNIIKSISYVLIAFVAISLVVSSIMIGIITYISVLERTKEIGILRSIGASKRDISLVFNTETLTMGFVAGALGIGVTLLLCIPANIIIKTLSDISGVAKLPPAGGVLLVIISMVLTLIAGLIPSRIAANKEPVV